LEEPSDHFSIAASDTGTQSNAWNTAVAGDSVEGSEQVDSNFLYPHDRNEGIIDNDT
jgi:hypothetical protein